MSAAAWSNCTSTFWVCALALTRCIPSSSHTRRSSALRSASDQPGTCTLIRPGREWMIRGPSATVSLTTEDAPSARSSRSPTMRAGETWTGKYGWAACAGEAAIRSGSNRWTLPRLRPWRHAQRRGRRRPRRRWPSAHPQGRIRHRAETVPARAATQLLQWRRRSRPPLGPCSHLDPPHPLLRPSNGHMALLRTNPVSGHEMLTSISQSRNRLGAPGANPHAKVSRHRGSQSDDCSSCSGRDARHEQITASCRGARSSSPLLAERDSCVLRASRLHARDGRRSEGRLAGSRRGFAQARACRGAARGLGPAGGSAPCIGRRPDARGSRGHLGRGAEHPSRRTQVDLACPHARLRSGEDAPP